MRSTALNCMVSPLGYLRCRYYARSAPTMHSPALPSPKSVGVAVDEDHVRFFLQEEGFELDEDVGGLLRVASGADSGRKEGDVGHVGVVVLSGVTEDVPPRVPSADFGADDGFFNELRARAYERDDLLHGCSS